MAEEHIDDEYKPEELTLEQRLEAMEMEGDENNEGDEEEEDEEEENEDAKENGQSIKNKKNIKEQTNKKKISTPAAQSLQNVLVQALHSNDSKLLEACIQHRNKELIETTVRRLPTSYVIPLLLQLIDIFQENPARAQAILDWILPTLKLHIAYLMTVPDLVGKLSNFYQAIDTHIRVLPKLLSLDGHLKIVNAQINVRNHKLGTLNQLSSKDEKPGYIYVEQVSDDEAEKLDDMDEEDLLEEDDDIDMDDDMDDSDEEGFEVIR